MMVTEKRWIKTRKIIRRLVDEVVSLRKGGELEDGRIGAQDQVKELITRHWNQTMVF
jgi:hypothetical protein